MRSTKAVVAMRESNLGARRYYFRGDEALYAGIDTYLIDATWVSGIS